MAPGAAVGSPCVGSAVAIPSLPVVVTPSPTEPLRLRLYSRQGCCLCEGLERRLRELDLSAITPPLQLEVVDIDAPACSEELRARYDLLVPVLALPDGELPRVSPRLAGEGLVRWLQRACTTTLGSD